MLFRSFIKRGVHEIDVLLIHLLLRQPKSFTEALEMDDLPSPQEADDVVHVRVVAETEDVVVGDPGLLFCCDLTNTTFRSSNVSLPVQFSYQAPFCRPRYSLSTHPLLPV